jgi:hypothetical protein
MPTLTVSGACALARYLAFASIVLSSGCSEPWTRSAAVPGPDGTTWYQITCHKDDVGCFLEAKRACPDGYEIKDHDRRKYYLIKCGGKGGVDGGE